MSRSRVLTSVGPADCGRCPLARQTVEFLVILALGILLFRTFTAEAYIVPTGSMAPTLLGEHEEIVCGNCGIRFALGLDEDPRPENRLCPNCGSLVQDRGAAVGCSGDRVLVQKFVYDLRRPQRWEVAVFHFPGEPSQAYVKRVVGLPGESIQIVHGDVLIDGRLARKTLREQRAMRILIYDHNFLPRDAARFPRWQGHRGRPGQEDDAPAPSGWRSEGTRFVFESTPDPLRVADPDRAPIDWLEYRHLGVDRDRRPGPVSDFMGYNGSRLRGENPVYDLMFEATLNFGPDLPDLTLRLDSGGDSFRIALPVTGRGSISVERHTEGFAPVRLPLKVHPDGLAALRSGLNRPIHLEASVMDQRLQAAVDGVLLFDPIDYDDRAEPRVRGSSPLALGVRRGSVRVGDLRLYRDVYYTSSLASVPRRPFGIDSPYVLGEDEYFVLGDNSPVSNDSRFWSDSPVVPRELFLGKPFLVHLPGQVVPLQVFGRPLYWVPDPREIRYIH